LIGLLPFFAQAFVGLLALRVPSPLNAVVVQLLSFRMPRRITPTVYVHTVIGPMNTLSQFARRSILLAVRCPT
jgi:hypothetical protein